MSKFLCNFLCDFYRYPIEILFKAENEAEVNFNLSCRVKKKTSPLAVNVKAEGFAIKMDLVCEDSLGNRVKLSAKGVNVINFGDVSKHSLYVWQVRSNKLP